MYDKFLSYVIREIRNIHNLTQKDLGQAIDKSEITIRKYETGLSKIPYTTLFMIITIIRIDIVTLKNIVDTVKETIKKDNVMDEGEIYESIRAFNDDVSKIFNTRIDLNYIDDMEALKIVFDNQLQEYIERSLTNMCDDALSGLIILGVNKHTTNKLRSDVMDYLDFKIERLYGFLTMKNK
jgi:hypothetical protein